MSDTPDDAQTDDGQSDGGQPDYGTHDAGKRGDSQPDGASRGAERRPGAMPNGRRPDAGRPTTGAPERGHGPRRDGHRTGRPSTGGVARSAVGRPERPHSGGDRVPGTSRGAGDSVERLWTKGGAPARGDRDARERELPEDRDPFGIRSVRPRHDDPMIPDDVKPADLDRIARNELKTLSKENAEGVACHLVMAARLIDENPALAHEHAISAARRAGRIGVVRETLAITAYATGDFGLALRELRTYRRISGRDDQLPMMVDSERGLGRPEKALELARSVPRASLPVPVQVELAIAMSGARLDLGQLDAALAELEIPQLDAATAFSYSPALFDAYATVLEELGRIAEAEQWYERSEIATDALAGGESADEDDVVEIIEEQRGGDDVD